MADYVAGDEGTVSVNKGNLVEVIDNSQAEWALIRTIGQYPQEGWIPSDFISPYNISDHQATEGNGYMFKCACVCVFVIVLFCC